MFDDLRERGNVFVHDQLGFGLSDKPALNFTYSIAEAADNSLIMWRKAGLRSAHVVAHDMGDTILTEILARRHRGDCNSWSSLIAKPVCLNKQLEIRNIAKIERSSILVKSV